mmetsp:Transcript_36163/g.87281  ORF Transcript_36163/g.87281 Transcript_36163/m.87281 type:complete len:228 (-) Transcript_36163:600-1283(-)
MPRSSPPPRCSRRARCSRGLGARPSSCPGRPRRWNGVERICGGGSIPVFRGCSFGAWRRRRGGTAAVPRSENFCRCGRCYRRARTSRKCDSVGCARSRGEDRPPPLLMPGVEAGVGMLRSCPTQPWRRRRRHQHHRVWQWRWMDRPPFPRGCSPPPPLLERHPPYYRPSPCYRRRRPTHERRSPRPSRPRGCYRPGSSRKNPSSHRHPLLRYRSCPCRTGRHRTYPR